MALPDATMRHELVAGEIIAGPLPSHAHDRVRRRIEQRLREFIEPRGLGEVFGRAGYLLARDPDTVRGPDLSFVRADRLAGIDDRRYFPGAPDLAVEIVTPKSLPADARGKLADYLIAGTKIVWVVDPVNQSVRVHRSLDAPESYDVITGEDLLPGLTIPLRSIFPS